MTSSVSYHPGLKAAFVNLEISDGAALYPRERIPPLLLHYAAALRTPWEIRCFDTAVNPDLTPASLSDYDPSLVLLEWKPPADSLAHAWATHLKRNGVATVVAAGTAATFEPETLLGEGKFDACLSGEFETPFLDLLAILSAGGDSPVVSLRGRTAVRINQEPDLDSLNAPQTSWQVGHGYRKLKFRGGSGGWGFILASRGCPFACRFCSPVLRHSFGRQYRIHSPSYVASLIDRFRRDHGIAAISFEDDLFGANDNWLLEMLDVLASRRLTWVAQTRADIVPLENIQHFARTGCAGIALGLESGSPRLQQISGKNLNLEKTLRFVRGMRQAGIPAVVNMDVGLPEETPEDRIETQRYLRRLRPLIIHLHYFALYTGCSYPAGTISFGDHNHPLVADDSALLGSVRMANRILIGHYCSLHFWQGFLRYHGVRALLSRPVLSFVRGLFRQCAGMLFRKSPRPFSRPEPSSSFRYKPDPSSFRLR